MQLHQIKPIHKNKSKKRIGRGGKRGTFSGRGSKGQNARGARLGADFRGGNPPIWKLFPKKRGSTKKTEIKHRSFRIKENKPAILNLKDLKGIFSEGETISPSTLKEKNILNSNKVKVKILSDGEIGGKFNFSGILFSKSAREKVIKAGGEIK